jgi:thioredoxin reductase (NADPH)
LRNWLTEIGSGCIAALEAEKFLSEQEDVESPLKESGAEKGNSVVVPEYRKNPLL